MAGKELIPIVSVGNTTVTTSLVGNSKKICLFHGLPLEKKLSYFFQPKPLGKATHGNSLTPGPSL
jgi:hypothetical protein